MTRRHVTGTIARRTRLKASGRGWAVLADDEIEGHLFFHVGDDSSFRAEPFTGADELDGQ